MGITFIYTIYKSIVSRIQKLYLDLEIFKNIQGYVILLMIMNNVIYQSR